MRRDRERFEAVNADILHRFTELVSELGGHVDPLLEQAGCAGCDPDTALQSLSYRQTILLMEMASQQIDCTDFGMRLAVRQRGQNRFGPLGNAMRNAPTFGAAIDYVCSHNYAHSLAVAVWLRRFPSVQHVFVGHDVLMDGVAHRAQAMEHILLVGHLFAMELTGGRARARRVHFRHHPLSDRKVYRRYFGCPVHFGQNEDGISFSDHDLASPIINPNADAFAAMSAQIEHGFSQRQPPFHARVRALIMQGLWSARCSNGHVATELKLHPRTLHRRLASEGTSFQKVKDEVRRDLLLYYLERSSLDFMAISEKLGFAEQSVMTRSCNQWFGVSPTTLRARRSLDQDNATCPISSSRSEIRPSIS